MASDGLGFDAGNVSELFDYKLKDGTKGRIPEPTDTEVEKFRAGTLGAQLAICGMTDEDVDADGGSELFGKKLDALTYEQRKDLTATMLEATIEFCNGSPTREQIEAMGALGQVAFIQHLRRILNPLF